MECSVNVLAKRLQFNHTSMVELVDCCQYKGLIRRHHSAADGPHVVISLTAEGEAFLRKLASAARRELNEIGSLLVKATKQLAPGTRTQANVSAATRRNQPAVLSRTKPEGFAVHLVDSSSHGDQAIFIVGAWAAFGFVITCLVI